MDGRSPLTLARPVDWSRKPVDPGFGPFDGEALQAELNRARAAVALRCAGAQIFVILLACLSAGFFFMLSWHQLARYDAALKACAGV